MRLQLHLLEERLEDSLLKFEAAEDHFARTKKRIIADNVAAGVAISDAEVRASAHRQVKDASTDCAYFRDRTIMYGIAAMVKRAQQQEEQHGNTKAA